MLPAPDPSAPAVVAHMGVVVPDLEAAARPYRDVLGCTVTEAEELPGAGIVKCYVIFANLYIELIQPTQDYEAAGHILEQHNVRDYLTRNPEGGLHHICLAVGDLEGAREGFAAQGYRIMGDRGGAGSGPIAWLDPAKTNNVLLEVKQAPAAS